MYLYVFQCVHLDSEGHSSDSTWVCTNRLGLYVEHCVAQSPFIFFSKLWTFVLHHFLNKSGTWCSTLSVFLFYFQISLFIYFEMLKLGRWLWWYTLKSLKNVNIQILISIVFTLDSRCLPAETILSLCAQDASSLHIRILYAESWSGTDF